MKPDKETVIKRAMDYFDRLKCRESVCEPEDGLINALKELDPNNEISMTELAVLKLLTESRRVLLEIEKNPALEEIYRYEQLPDNFLSSAGVPLHDCEGNWMPVTTSEAATMLKATYDCAEDALTAEGAQEVLETGIALHLPLNYLRKRTELPKCPCCASSIPKGTAALSRRDNQTHICAACGLREALEDFLQADGNSKEY